MRRTVLFIEDDERLSRVVEMSLSGEGFDVERAATGEDGLAAIESRSFDVVLLDVLLPGKNGFEVCREIRRVSDAPIIMVTARTDSHDVVAGLEAGADDYVRKPFVVKELSARIRALLRRFDGVVKPRQVIIDDLEVDPSAGVVSRGGVPVDLTKTEFRLLCELAAAPGRVVSREELLERVWGYGYFGDGRLVDVHIARLRKKVERDSSHPEFVVTVRGMGYRLVV